MMERIEMRAAELAASARDARASWRYRRALARWSADENRGWRAHLLGVAAECGRSHAWLAGWLGREIWMHEQEPSVSERIISGRAHLGRGGQHVNDGSESSMVLVIDDAIGLGVYCHTERSLYANREKARAMLAKMKEAP